MNKSVKSNNIEQKPSKNTINKTKVKNNVNEEVKEELNEVKKEVKEEVKKELNEVKEEVKEDSIQEPIKQQKGLKRNTIDKYYTKSSIVDQCINLVKKYIKIAENDLIIEPSAGNGAFIENIKTLTKNYKFYDLEPEHKEIHKQDFLELDYNILQQEFATIHVIGNPPFGRQASQAIKFIKKCCLFAQSISFILPKSFKKDSMKKYIDKNYHLMYEIDLEENAFLVNNIESNVPCVFQIWQYQEDPRQQADKKMPTNFKFVKKDANPDISFRRVGVNAGTIMKEIKDKSFQSHYFIKFTNNKPIEANIQKLKAIKFDFNNTVGPKSISKQELIEEFNKVLN